MSYSQQYQLMLPLLREQLRYQVTQMGNAAGKPVTFSDEVLNDFAVVFALGMLSGQTVAIAFAAAYQAMYGIQQED
jgi:hypothetical protein